MTCFPKPIHVSYNKRKETTEAVRSLNNITIVFRSIQILTEVANECISFSVMIGQKIICALVIIVSTYVVIKLNHTLTVASLLCYVFAGIAAGFVSNFIYTLVADLSMEASMFRSSWVIERARFRIDLGKQVTTFPLQIHLKLNEDKELVRLLRSSPDFRIKVGSYYNFKKTTPTTFSRIVVDNTINLLLAI